MKTIAQKNYVKAESLPRCLRHASMENAEFSAVCITAFLREATAAILKRHSDVGEPNDLQNILYGLEQCFHLLEDNINIATGRFSFPKAGYPDKDFPPLYDPDNKEGRL